MLSRVGFCAWTYQDSPAAAGLPLTFHHARAQMLLMPGRRIRFDFGDDGVWVIVLNLDGRDFREGLDKGKRHCLNLDGRDGPG